MIYCLLPTKFSFTSNLREENQVYGEFLQTTGIDFLVIKETIHSGLVDDGEKIYHLNLTGNTPNFTKHYEQIMSKCILKGKIVGKEKLEGIEEEVYIFQVTDYKLTDYIPKIWSSNLLYLFLVSVVIFTILSLVFLLTWLKKRNNNT
ncbi:MAG: hypothetical protein CSA38_00040 [Flavobacteriales bacterium]|nr:MAG: hypothetical protein CSA38_00040 [Flavobacteriales bacterium]